MTTYEVLKTITREEGLALYNEKKSDKEIYDLLVSKGLTDNFETFKSEAQKFFTEKVSNMSKEEILAQIDGAELTDDQLEMIAGGGKNVGEIIGVAVSGAGIIGVGIAAASAF